MHDALKSLPHGPEFRFVDTLTALDPGKSGSGQYTVRGDEPFLSGHFPGQPVVPGVVLLDRVAAAVERWQGRSLARLTQVKFLQPLLPGQDAELSLNADGARLRFHIVATGREIASGIVEAAP